ncbi:MAG: hypothetical protein ACI9XK_003255, partial [Granulosicoccus sp.]
PNDVLADGCLRDELRYPALKAAADDGKAIFRLRMLV